MSSSVEAVAANSAKQSHSLLPIEPRKVRFDYAEMSKACFFTNNIVSSAFFVGLSATFPEGEAEFIRSVNLFKDQITDPKLLEEVEQFTAQEAHHSLQHKRINKKFSDAGYPIEDIESNIKKELKSRATDWAAERRLRQTVSAEHFVATMAHWLLRNPEALDPTPKVFKNLMLWHAIEEVEHKSVAFDVYKEAVGDMKKLRRHYWYFALVDFPLSTWMITRHLLKQGGFKVTWRNRIDFLKLLFGKKGIFRSEFSVYAQFVKKDFHPWQHDNSDLINKWKQELSPYFVNK